LTGLTWSSLTTAPIHSKPLSATLSKSLYTSYNSWTDLILHIPRSYTDFLFPRI
jgi:hypothetical protein